jgi:hypothetical protein
MKYLKENKPYSNRAAAPTIGTKIRGVGGLLGKKVMNLMGAH